MTDEPQPDTPAEGDELELDEDRPILEEPFEATRLSPYAVVTFVAGLLAVYISPIGNFPFSVELSWRSALLALAPAGVAAVTIWLSGRAAEEIFVSDGRLGGVGYLKAGRALAVLAIIVVGAPLLLGAIGVSVQ